MVLKTTRRPCWSPDLQLFIEALQLSRGGRRGAVVKVRMVRLQSAAPQRLQLVAQLLHPGHCEQQLPLLLLEQAAHLLDLVH